MIYWFVGQPGAGKTVLANALAEKFRETQDSSEIFRIDGDDLRALTVNKDYSKAGREANIKRAQAIAHYLSNQGKTVIVSLVAPYRDLREQLKKVASVREFYVHTTNIRGREHYHADDFEKPQANFTDIDTSDISIEKSLAQVLESFNDK